MNAHRLGPLLKAAGEHVELFDDRTVQFVEDMMDRLEKWGERVLVSERQEKWLKSVERELKRNGVDLEEFE